METNSVLSRRMTKKKDTIPKALREQVWIQNFGRVFEHKCFIQWCSNKITVFDFHVGHDQPESKGGETVLQNLKPICSRCNQSMNCFYSIQEWQSLGKDKSVQATTCWSFWRYCKKTS